jgi:hypothetical protein
MAPTLDELDARLREIEAVQQLILRILSTTKPLDNVLEQYGATDTQERAFYVMLDDMTARTSHQPEDQPSFAFFVMRVQDIFPALRNDREFINLLVDTLRMERPAYRALADYAKAHGWPAWT